MRSPLAEQVGEILTAHRENRLKLSRRELARRLKIANTTLLEVELGRSNATLERLERLAEGYGLTLELKARPVARKKSA